MNLPEQLQEYLHYPKLQLIDVNTGLPEHEEVFDAPGQAVLIAFLTGLYAGTRSKEAAAAIAVLKDADQLLKSIFENENEILNTISAFTKQPVDISKNKLTEVSKGFIAYLQQHIPAEELNKEGYLQGLMTTQRHEILRYLPTGLRLGDSLKDETLEDKSNKMEGPISSLMHKIESSFSTSD